MADINFSLNIELAGSIFIKHRQYMNNDITTANEQPSSRQGAVSLLSSVLCVCFPASTSAACPLK